MKNIRTRICEKVNFFRCAKYQTKTDDYVKHNVYDNVIDKTLIGVRDILKILIYSQIENKIEKQHEEY